MLESQDIEDREAIPRAENLLLSLEELLAAGLHIGTRIKTVDMERYIFRVRPDGLFILNIGDTNEKIRIAARFMGRFDPGRVLAVSSRLYGKTPVERFAEVTRTVPIVGRFMPGLISNPLQPHHAEPQVVLVTDPRADWQASRGARHCPVRHRQRLCWCRLRHPGKQQGTESPSRCLLATRQTSAPRERRTPPRRNNSADSR